MTTLATLNPAALVTLADCEQRIERGLKTFIDVGQALAEIRDSRLYRASHETFEEYLEKRWQMSRSYAHRMIAAAEVVLPMGNIGLPTPDNERQTRELAKVPEPDRADVWRKAVERTEGKPTAAVVRQVVAERTPTPGPSDAAVTPPVDPGASPAPAGHSVDAPNPQEPDPPVVPPPGSPATWTPEQRAAHDREVQDKQIRAAARRHAARLVSEVRGQIVTVISGIDLGETDLINKQMIADLRAVIDLLETRLEANR